MEEKIIIAKLVACGKKPVKKQFKEMGDAKAFVTKALQERDDIGHVEIRTKTTNEWGQILSDLTEYYYEW